MLAKGTSDPYTRFITPEEFESMRKYDVTGVGLHLGTAEEYVKKTGLQLPPGHQESEVVAPVYRFMLACISLNTASLVCVCILVHHAVSLMLLRCSGQNQLKQNACPAHIWLIMFCTSDHQSYSLSMLRLTLSRHLA